MQILACIVDLKYIYATFHMYFIFLVFLVLSQND